VRAEADRKGSGSLGKDFERKEPAGKAIVGKSSFGDEPRPMDLHQQLLTVDKTGNAAVKNGGDTPKLAPVDRELVAEVVAEVLAELQKPKSEGIVSSGSNSGHVPAKPNSKGDASAQAIGGIRKESLVGLAAKVEDSLASRHVRVEVDSKGTSSDRSDSTVHKEPPIVHPAETSGHARIDVDSKGMTHSPKADGSIMRKKEQSPDSSGKMQVFVPFDAAVSLQDNDEDASEVTGSGSGDDDSVVTEKGSSTSGREDVMSAASLWEHYSARFQAMIASTWCYQHRALSAILVLAAAVTVLNIYLLVPWCHRPRLVQQAYQCP